MSRTDGLYTAVQRQVINQMLKAASSDDKTKIVRAFQLAEKITPDQYKGSVRFVTEKIKDDHPALTISKHVTSRLSPRCRDRFIECLIVNTLLRGVAKRRELIDETGFNAPTTILMSPTMRCNLSCDGCYAAEYSPDQDLDRGLMQKIVDEGNDMGVYLFTLLGGEPFMWDELLDFARENKDAYFQVFTNGTLLDDDTIDELARVGNIAPMLSVEGTAEMTDRRRGSGVHRQVMGVMDRLGAAGVLFGYSVTVARNNWRMLVSDEFVEPLVARAPCWAGIFSICRWGATRAPR
jgi:sulfatase maturation enzyme AslB (radical SAM superfamily)